jgi:hypothetical protein
VSNARITAKNKFEKANKEAAVDYFMLRFQHLPERIEENQDNRPPDKESNPGHPKHEKKIFN